MIAAFVFVGPALAAGFADAVAVDRVVAVVDHAVVLESELGDVVGADARNTALDARIASALIDAEAKRLRIDATDAEVARALRLHARRRAARTTPHSIASSAPQG